MNTLSVNRLRPHSPSRTVIVAIAGVLLILMPSNSIAEKGAGKSNVRRSATPEIVVTGKDGKEYMERVVITKGGKRVTERHRVYPSRNRRRQGTQNAIFSITVFLFIGFIVLVVAIASSKKGRRRNGGGGGFFFGGCGGAGCGGGGCGGGGCGGGC